MYRWTETNNFASIHYTSSTVKTLRLLKAKGTNKKGGAFFDFAFMGYLSIVKILFVIGYQWCPLPWPWP
jgi:hypothetical protein